VDQTAGGPGGGNDGRDGAGGGARELRSAQWYRGTDRNAYIHRAWMRRGLPSSSFTGERPQIAIANTASELTPCNMHLDEIATAVKGGVFEAGGVPLNLPVMSLGETQVRPTAMLWRNLAAMAIEEMLRANPIDAVVLLGGCDKTIPALLMAAASVDLPAVVVPGGPMLTGHFRGRALGCGTDVWRLSEEVRAGTLSGHAFQTRDFDLASASVVLPASTVQVFTSVAPFQLAYTTEPPAGFTRAAAAGLSVGCPVQAAVKAR